MHPIKRAVLRIGDAAGLFKVSAAYRSFIRMHGFFIFATNLSGMFISTFLLKAGSSVTTIGLYYLLAYLFEGMLYFLTTQMSGRFRPTTLSRLGLFIYTCSYIILLVFRENTATVFPVVALASALGASLYWLPFQFYTLMYTSLGDRQASVSLMGVIANLIMLLTPPVSGSVIYFLPGMNGYIVVFVMSVLSFMMAALQSRTMPSEPGGGKGNPLADIIRRDFRDKLAVSLSMAHFFHGIRDGLFLYYLNLLIFTITANELIIGLNVTGRGILVMVMYVLITRRDNLWLRRWGPLLIGLCMIVLTAGVSLWYSTATVILLSLLDAALQTYNGNALQFSSYHVGDYLSKRDGVDRYGAVIALRSMVLNVGRVAGMAMFVLLPPDFGSPALILLLLSVLSLPASFFLYRIQTAVSPVALPDVKRPAS